MHEFTKLLVSRRFYHGGDGLERMNLCFFHSREEYEEEAKKRRWDDSETSFKTSWCTPPVEVEALVEAEALARFKQDQALSMDKVFFQSDLATLVHYIGGQ